MKNKAFLFFLFLVALPMANAQPRIIDSLRQNLSTFSTKDTNYVLALKDLGNHLIDANPSELKDIGQKMIEVSQAINYPNGRLAGLGFFGIYHAIRGEYDAALENFHLALETAGKVQNSGIKITMLNNIAGIYYLREEYAKAKKYMQASAKANEELGARDFMAINILSMGQLYYTWYSDTDAHESIAPSPTLLDTSIQYFSLALAEFKAQGRQKKVGQATIGIGISYGEQGKYKLALEYCKEALQIAESLKDFSSIAYDQDHIGKLFLKMNNGREAEANFLNALATARKMEIRPLEMTVLGNLVEAYRMQNKYRQALETKEELVALEKVVFDETAENKLKELEIQYETREKEKENQLLNEKNRLLLRQNNLWLALAGGIFTLLLLSIFFYKRLGNKNQTINKQKHLLEKLNNTKDQFFGIIAHDLRGPMLSFRGLNKKINYLVEHQKQDQIEALGESVESAYHKLDHLLDNLLQWALTQKGTLPFHPQKIALRPLAQEVMDLFADLAQTKSIELDNQIKEDAYLVADVNALSAIIRNLINNSVKFSDKGGSISISSLRIGGGVQLKLSDEGIGLDPKELASLFNFNSKNKKPLAAAKERGTGLGLQLCKELTELHGGNIKVESSLGVGTQVYVNLPVEGKES